MPRSLDHFRVSRRAVLAAAVAAIAPSHALPKQHAVAQSQWTLTWESLPAGGGGPPPRWDHVLVADEAGGRLILFGGRDNAGASLNDTWVYNLQAAAWTQIAVDGPSPRFGSAAAVEAGLGKLFLFGGQSADLFFNDVWEFDFATDTWQQVHTGDGVAPSPRYGLGGVITEAGQFIVSHGFTFDGRFDDTWVFSIQDSAWGDISPVGGSRPLKRCLHEQVWLGEVQVMLLYGGCSSGFGPCPQGDLWTFNPAGALWSDVTPASGPEARSNPALTRLPISTATLLVGGLTAAGPVADAWVNILVEDVFTWTPVAVAGQGPSPRSSHDMVTLGDRVYLFGGLDAAGALGDLWSGMLA